MSAANTQSKELASKRNELSIVSNATPLIVRITLMMIDSTGLFLRMMVCSKGTNTTVVPAKKPPLDAVVVLRPNIKTDNTQKSKKPNIAP